MRARKFWYHVHYHFTLKSGEPGTGSATYYTYGKKIVSEETLKKIKEHAMGGIYRETGREVKSLTISSYTFIRESRG